MQVVEIWGDSIRITRRLRLYDDQPVITISASITNTGDRDASLGAASLVDVSDAAMGGWELGAVDGAPGVVYRLFTSVLFRARLNTRTSFRWIA
jgi:hypothetical protein